MSKRLLIWTVAIVLGCLAATPAVADDLNPPFFRGDPLSVQVEWARIRPEAFPADTYLFKSVDDANPDTYLASMLPSWEMPDTNTYYFAIPNFIDDLPLKLMRIQVTWSGTTVEPGIGDVFGYENNETIPGVVVGTSTPNVYTQPDGGYMYWDLEIRPNPDWESFMIHMAAEAQLEQVVVDTISLPEPATALLLTLGAALLRRRRR